MELRYHKIAQQTCETVYLLAALLQSSVSAQSLPSSLHREILASRNHSTGAFSTPLAITQHDDKLTLLDHGTILIIQYTCCNVYGDIKNELFSLTSILILSQYFNIQLLYLSFNVLSINYAICYWTVFIYVISINQVSNVH